MNAKTILLCLLGGFTSIAGFLSAVVLWEVTGILALSILLWAAAILLSAYLFSKSDILK